MAFTSTESVWNFNQSSPSHNRTQEEVEYFLEKLNQETFIKLIPMIVFLTVLIVVGALGNLLVFLVYLKQFKASATRVFVLGMAVCDFLTNVLTLPWYAVDLRYRYTPDDVFCKIKNFLAYFPIVMSYLILVCVALDRRRRICQIHKRQLNARQAIYMLIVPLTLVTATAFSVMFFYGVRPQETDIPGITGTVCGFSGPPTKVNMHRVFGIVVMGYFIVGFGLLTICYVQISYRIYQQKKRLLRAGQGIPNKCKFSGQKKANTDKLKGTALVKTPAVSRDQGVFITSESSDSCASDGTKESSCSQNVENIAVTDFTTNQNQEKPCDVSDPRGCTAVSDVTKSLIVTTTIGSPNRNDEDKSREEDTSRSFAHGRQSVEQGQKRKPFMSRTTLMMFVLTVATLLFCVPPNFAVM